MRSLMCVDAGVFVKALVQEDLSDLARQLWETWTADERLYNSVKDGFPLIHWLGERGKVP